MLLNGKSLIGYKINAQDGVLGKVQTFFFSDDQWKLRYFILSSANRLGRKRVVITPSLITGHDWTEQRFDVRLSREMVRNSPDLDTEHTVSCQMQENLDRYYGCVFESRGEGHLHSGQEMIGLDVQSPDGKSGRVADIITDDSNWSIPYFVLDTRSWLSGKSVLVPVSQIAGMEWDRENVSIRLSREKIKDAPGYDPSFPISRDYEKRLFDYYGAPGYWGDVTELIRRKAQELCNRRGCTPGNELGDWLEAERIVKSELKR